MWLFLDLLQDLVFFGVLISGRHFDLQCDISVLDLVARKPDGSVSAKTKLVDDGVPEAAVWQADEAISELSRVISARGVFLQCLCFFDWKIDCACTYVAEMG